MNRFHWRLLTLLFVAAPAFAGTITYTGAGCPSSPSVTPGSGASPLPSAACTLLTTIADQYNTKTGSINGLFTNATASIYVQLNNTGGDVADNDQFYTTVSYQNYYLALKANESGANDVTAVNSLPVCTAANGGGASCVNPVAAGDGVALTTPLYSVLNAKVTLGGSIFGICTDFQSGSGCTVSGGTHYGSCTLGTSNCYNDIINVSNSASGNPAIYFSGTYVNGDYDFFTAVEHETDEALGTASCIGNTTGTPQISTGCTNGGTGVSAADLFRYSAPGVRSFTSTATGSSAYFSINNGAFNIVSWNNSANGGDYGDFSTNCKHVQDVDGCNSGSGMTLENDGGVEIALLDAVGYNLTSTGQSFDDGGLTSPEPSTVVMALAGIGAIGFFARRCRVRENG